MMIKKSSIFSIWITVSFLLTGCPEDQSVKGTESGTGVVTEPDPTPPPPLTAPEHTVCDPFSTNSPSARDRGVIANMVWLDDTMPPRNGQPSLQHVSDYLNIGNIVESTLYFDRIFVPTRAFDLGFTTQAGETLLNHLGQPMYEYFALHMESQLQLGENDPEGFYQIAVLSDDGAVLKIQNDQSEWRTIVNNDGNHPTKMSCPVELVEMKKGVKRPMILDYYQGPRFHISLVVVWRKVPDGTDPDIPINDPRCGQSGNSLFFNSTVVPTQTKTPFYEVLSRGWKVPENVNYSFPEQASNPCIPAEETLAISDFQISNITRTTATLVWNTNIDAFSKVEVRKVSDGTTLQTVFTTIAAKAHSITVSNLLPNTLYAFKGISQSAGGQTATSDERALRTPR